MAVDSRNKRVGGISAGRPWIVIPPTADGSVDAPDRQQMADAYPNLEYPVAGVVYAPHIVGSEMCPIEVVAPWAKNYTGTLVGGVLAAELVAAPTRANSATYITHVTMGITRNPVFINHTPDAKITLIDGVGDCIFGPIQFEENGQTFMSKDFTKPLKITDKKAVDFLAGGAVAGYQAAIVIYIEGFTGDKPLG